MYMHEHGGIELKEKCESKTVFNSYTCTYIDKLKHLNVPKLCNINTYNLVEMLIS